MFKCWLFCLWLNIVFWDFMLSYWLSCMYPRELAKKKLPVGILNTKLTNPSIIHWNCLRLNQFLNFIFLVINLLLLKFSFRWKYKRSQDFLLLNEWKAQRPRRSKVHLFLDTNKGNLTKSFVLLVFFFRWKVTTKIPLCRYNIKRLAKY